MKIIIKTIKGESFPLEAEASETIASIKGKITAEKGWAAESLKLVHKGNQAQDAQTLESLNVAEGDFMVVMVLKVWNLLSLI